MRTDRCEELTDEDRDEIAALDRHNLRAWLAYGNHCTHCPDGHICADCRADYTEDPSAWLEFGAHPEGEANWQREEAQLEQDCLAMSAMAARPDDPTIPF